MNEDPTSESEEFLLRPLASVLLTSQARVENWQLAVFTQFKTPHTHQTKKDDQKVENWLFNSSLRSLHAIHLSNHPFPTLYRKVVRPGRTCHWPFRPRIYSAPSTRNFPWPRCLTKGKGGRDSIPKVGWRTPRQSIHEGNALWPWRGHCS